MTGPQPHISKGDVCPGCGRAWGACVLTCPTLRLPRDTYLWGDQDEDGTP